VSRDPQFSFNVLSLALDQQEKGRGAAEGGGAGTPVVHTDRKRARHSQGG
jgi:hypothetical protein